MLLLVCFCRYLSSLFEFCLFSYVYSFRMTQTKKQFSNLINQTQLKTVVGINRAGIGKIKIVPKKEDIFELFHFELFILNFFFELIFRTFSFSNFCPGTLFVCFTVNALIIHCIYHNGNTI